MANSDRKGVAFVGCGRIGLVHVKNAVCGGRLDVLWVVEADMFVQKSRDTLSSLGPWYKDIKVTGVSNLPTVLNDDRVSGVVVSTPTPYHEEVCLAASKAGKHVFCEKPLAPTISSIERMYDAAELAGKHFLCAFSRRFDPQLRRLHDQIREGKVGKVRIVKSTSRDPKGMSTKEYLLKAGGTFIDSAVHDLDQLLWLSGEEPEWVFAAGHATTELFRESNDTDTSTVFIKFSGGAIGEVEMSKESPTGYDQRVEVLGTEGAINSENVHQYNLTYHTQEVTSQDPILDGFIERYSAAFQEEMKHFADILEGKCEPYVTRKEAVTVHKLCMFCNESLKTGKKINFE